MNNESFNLRICNAFNTIVNFTFSGEIKQIGNSTFNALSTLEILELPKNLESIGDLAFRYTSITKLTIPNTVTYIGKDCFNYCYKLEKVTFPSTLEITNEQFSSCSALSQVVINGVSESFSSQSLRSFSSITHVSFTEGIKEIGKETFRGMNLKDIILPSTVETIDEYAFAELPTLETIIIPTSIKSINETAFDGTENIYEITFIGETEEFNICVYPLFNAKNLTSVMFISVESICDYAFSQCSALKTISFMNELKLKTIGKYAFQGCSKLSQLSVPSSVTSIQEGAFENCISLRFISLKSNDLKEIENNLFRGCSSLRTIEFPSSIYRIGMNTFSSCNTLLRIDFPQELNTIDTSAFANCTALQILEFPNSLQSIGDKAFQGCDFIKSVIKQGNLLNINDKAFADCASLNYFFYNGTEIPKVSSTAFDGCKQLNSITVPENFKGDSFGDYTIKYIDGQVVPKEGTDPYLIALIVCCVVIAILIIVIIILICLYKKKKNILTKNEISVQLV